MSITEKDIELIKAELARECDADHVGLWSIVWNVRYALNGGRNPRLEEDRTDPQELRQITMRLVRDLLHSGVQAGNPTPDGRGFVPWRGSSTDIMSRINSGWDALDREPNIGEIVWFTAPDRTDLPEPGDTGGIKQAGCN